MKRYIEIVYDNSGSMTDYLGSKRKYELARDLFEKEILPVIGKPEDHVVLRTLGSGCHYGTSGSVLLPNNPVEMLKCIYSIHHDHATPLFYTIADAVKACQLVQADEHLIFVLTDGDDTCQINISDLIDEETLQKYVRYYRVLLVQLAIDSVVSKNNLTAAMNYLGGQVLSLDRNQGFGHMRASLHKSLMVSGFAASVPLPQCFEELSGADMPWYELEKTGVNMHHALLLYNRQLLTWRPDASIPVTALQLAELNFLFALCFKTEIPPDLAKTMLDQLQKPYYYSMNCIYWDFSSARWKYFKKANPVHQVPNKAAKREDYYQKPFLDEDWDEECYNEDTVYRVVSWTQRDEVTRCYQLKPEAQESDSIDFQLTKKTRVKKLRKNDLVKFSDK